MALDTDYAISLDQLAGLLRAAHKPNRVILAKILDEACTRIPNLARRAKDRIIRLVELDAWNDVAFALIELELPAWKIRRLAYEDGEWLCSLSPQPNLPITLDDCAEATQRAPRKLYYLAAPKLLSHTVNLKYVLGDIQTNRGNLHVDGSLV